MNLSDSMKFVLKNKGPNLLADFWHQDIKGILKDFKRDLFKVLAQAPRDKSSFKAGLYELKDMAKDAMVVVGELPSRVKLGFSIFRDEVLEELDKIEDPKKKTIFCLRIAGALTSFAVTAIYGVKTAKKEIKISGLANRKAFTQFIVAELALRMSHFFVLRFLREVEKQMDNPEELKKIRFFKKMLSSKPTGNELNDLPEENDSDPAFRIVNNLNNYILTGKK